MAIERSEVTFASGDGHYPDDHFGAFIDYGPQRVAADQVEFLGRQALLAP